MSNVNLSALRGIARAIKLLDETPNTPIMYGGQKNANRAHNARVNLINILFDNGYELERSTYKLIKSKSKRELMNTVE